MTITTQLQKTTPVAAFGFTDTLNVSKNGALVSLETQGGLRMCVQSPDILVSSVRRISWDSLTRKMASLSRGTTSWRDRCHASLTCIAADGLIHEICKGNIWSVDEEGIKMVFIRSFSPVIGLSQMDCPENYLPVATFANCLTDLYGEGLVNRDTNIIFGSCSPDVASLFVLWHVNVNAPPEQSLWPYMISIRNQILCIEEAYASRLIMGDVTTPRSTADLLRAGQSLSRIEKLAFKEQYSIDIGNHIGSGGVGQLYLATRDDGQKVALKVLAPDLRFNIDNDAINRFQEEYKVLQTMDSVDATPKVYSAGKCMSRNFFLQDYIPCNNIKHWLWDDNPSMRDRIKAIRNLIRAVSVMHSAGVVHRDLSPKNFLVTANGSEVWIVDFGVAIRPSRVDAAVQPTCGLRRVGSLKYTAPEVRDSPTNACFASDIFSLGVIIYEIALRKEVAGNLPPLEDLIVGFPADISSFAATAISFELRNRPSLIESPVWLEGPKRSRL